MKRLLEFPAVVAQATERRAPHAVPIYAIRVADDFHRFYHEHRVLESEQEAFRLGLVRAVQLVIARCLDLVGVDGAGADVGSGDVSAEIPDRNLALELVRVTESAATFASRWIGRGDKIAADQAAVDAMRLMLDTVSMRGVVVIGEGEKDEAPMLFNGEEIGDGTGPEVDVAVDPLEGTRLTALGMPNAIAVIAVSERGTMFDPGAALYMNKIAVGPEAADAIDIDATPTENLERVAEAKQRRRQRPDRRRPRARPPRRPHRRAPRGRRAREPHPRRRRRAGDRSRAGRHRRRPAHGHRRDARGRHLGRGDQVPRRCDAGKAVAAQRRRATAPPRLRASTSAASLTADDLVQGEDVFVAATGVTSGALLRGVRVVGDRVETESIVMRSRSGTVRRIVASHPLTKIQSLMKGAR